MVNQINENASLNKTLTDIINPETLELQAMLHWLQLSNAKKKQKGFVYNKVLQSQWNITENLNWVCHYTDLNDIQKRMLLKKELINAYNNLDFNDKTLFNQYVGITEMNIRWHTLSQEEKKKIFNALFKFF